MCHRGSYRTRDGTFTVSAEPLPQDQIRVLMICGSLSLKALRDQGNRAGRVAQHRHPSARPTPHRPLTPMPPQTQAPVPPVPLAGPARRSHKMTPRTGSNTLISRRALKDHDSERLPLVCHVLPSGASGVRPTIDPNAAARVSPRMVALAGGGGSGCHCCWCGGGL